MASTPIYSWPTPDNTGLVKNGALDIRSLGNAIDTTMATMVPKTIVDAKGDLIAGTAADTTSRLAVGNNGETLVADSSTSTGLRYQAPVNSNPVLNSAFQVWQRGTSIAIAAAAKTFASDRWWGARGGSVAGSTVSRQVTGDTTNLPFIQYCSRVQRDSGNTSTAFISYNQDFESINSIPYAGKTVTFSFYARAGANFSAASNALAFSVVTGTGTDQSLSTGYTGQVTAFSGTATLTTTWQRFTFTGSIASTATQIGLQPYYTPVGTAGANDYFEITGVQLEVGSVATPFKTYAGTIQGELAACQRYYLQSSLGAYYATGSATTTTDVVFAYPLPVQMRTTPSASMSAVGDFLLIGASNKTFTSINNNSTAGSTAVSSFYTSGSSGLTAGYSYTLYSTTGSIKFSAEL